MRKSGVFFRWTEYSNGWGLNQSNEEVLDVKRLKSIDVENIINDENR